MPFCPEVKVHNYAVIPIEVLRNDGQHVPSLQVQTIHDSGVAGGKAAKHRVLTRRTEMKATYGWFSLPWRSLNGTRILYTAFKRFQIEIRWGWNSGHLFEKGHNSLWISTFEARELLNKCWAVEQGWNQHNCYRLHFTAQYAVQSF